MATVVLDTVGQRRHPVGVEEAADHGRSVVGELTDVGGGHRATLVAHHRSAPPGSIVAGWSPTVTETGRSLSGRAVTTCSSWPIVTSRC